MKHKMVHYKGYFLLALVFVAAGAILSSVNDFQVFPLFVAGFVLWAMGCVKVAKRNSMLKGRGEI